MRATAWGVKRDRQEVWSDEFALVLPDRGT